MLLPFRMAELQRGADLDGVMGRGQVLTLNEFGVLLLYQNRLNTVIVTGVDGIMLKGDQRTFLI